MSTLLGTDFFSVLTRGSQYQVECVLSRIVNKKDDKLLLYSPASENVRRMRALEKTAHLLEPKLGFHSDPVLVFDFRSLYPSIIIAYNICFSTCLGLLRNKGEAVAAGLGCDPLFRSPLLESNVAGLFVAPNGSVFAEAKVKEGVLPAMLSDLILTRILLKRSMENEKEREVIRVKNLQQFGLKYLANVVYGYAAASFSGWFCLKCIYINLILFFRTYAMQ